MTVVIPVKKVVAVFAAAGLMGVAYYGSYLPMRKSQGFISALRRLGEVKNIEEFRNNFDAPLQIPSPIGHEELVRNVGSVVANIVSSNPQSPETIAAAISYLDGYYQPIIQGGRGMSFTQNLYLLGNLNQAAFLRTGNSAYLLAAEQYYLLGHEASPKRPQFLYGLFDVYRIKRDVDGARAITDKILSIWPDDDRVRKSLIEFEEQIKNQKNGEENAGARKPQP
jgi:hypothetical protein